MTLLIGIAIIAVVALVWISVYNGLVKSRMQTKEAWSQIDVQLKRRNDLIPNLVNTVKGYADFEKSTLQAVTDARTNVTSAQGPAATMAASDQLSNALTHLFAVAEAYPDLKASANFTKLQEELTNTENKIAYSRQLFNTTTASYNTKLKLFLAILLPASIILNPANLLRSLNLRKKCQRLSFNVI